LHYVLSGGRRAARLVLIAPALPDSTGGQVDGLPEPFAAWQADLRRDRPRLAARLAETWLAGASAETARWLGDGMLSAANHALIHGLDTLAFPHLAEPLESVTLPTTIIHGRDDPVIPFARAEQAAAAIPQARLIALDTPGHLPMIGAPEQLAAAIRRDE
jgi:pimeloyl-ACP methyl ester carboxylesterase